MTIKPFKILLLGGLVLTIGDLIFKSWIQSGMGFCWLYVIGTLVYLIGTLLLVESYKYNVNIGVAGVMEVLFNTLILIIFSFFYFHEPLTARQLSGIALGLLSLYLIK